ncbi:MAG: hypothetical protein NVS3B5_22060 [Sphingomicrobium sp.]
MREAQVDQGEFGAMLGGGFEGRFKVISDRHDLVTRIILDQIFQCRRELLIILDDQYPEHDNNASPLRINHLSTG